jgi:subtilisin family serine protease
MTLRGQGAGGPRLQILESVGLPAIDEGLLQDDTHTPSSPTARLRTALREALQDDRVGASGSHYRAGRVIVRFRDEAAMTDRRAAVRAASDTGEIAARPSYADFDVVRIDPSEDAEEAASVLRQRPEVQYAQIAHRVHALLVPNDPLYPSQQWNLPMINIEKAWDIQPLAGSAITVAVVDSGMAYQNATLTATLPAFRDASGRLYPALGKVTIPYSAAPQLVSSTGASRIVAPHDFVNETSTPLDFEGHGTHVSGTIGQLTNDGIGTAGVAFNVKLMPVKVLASEWDLLFAGFNNISNTGGTDDDVALMNRFNVPTADLPIVGGTPYDVPTPESYGVQSGLLTQAIGRGIATMPGGIPLLKAIPDPMLNSPFTVVGGIGVFFPGLDGYATHEQGFIPGVIKF